MKLDGKIIVPSESESRYETPWWETELPAVRNELIAYLRRHLPALQSEHDDLLSDTFLALATQIQQRSKLFPPSWFQQSIPADEAESSRLHRLAMVILKRRIADLFRKRASHPIFFPVEEVEHELPDSHAQVSERSMILSKMLQVTLQILDEMPSEDRDLVAFVSRHIGLRKGLNARDRQRLHRIRNKLKEEIARRLGAEAIELLRIPD